MLARGTPYVVMYRSSWATYFLGQILITVKLFSLPNLIAGRKVMPEYFSVGDPTPVIGKIVAEITQWLESPAALAKAKEDLDSLRRTIQQTGATRRAADVILGFMEGKHRNIPDEPDVQKIAA
jgi:lipid-A-disaccharide synthase